MENMQTPEDTIKANREIRKYRDWFRAAVDKAQEWREEAREDYEFVAGKQWTDADKARLMESGRPALTINRIKPIINLLSGYQRSNRYDIDFLPRTNDDMALCQVRKGITKYIMDRCDYDGNESQVFLDAAICGLGWFEVGYRFDPAINDGEAYIHREDPFGMYVDPEARKPDYSDARYMIRAKWVDKEELKAVYPEFADVIDVQTAKYDSAERDNAAQEMEGHEPLWYQRQTHKVRLCECWYKEKVKETFFYLTDGTTVKQADVQIPMFLNGSIEGVRTVLIDKVRVAAFIENILLEDIESPYEHGELPFVPLIVYHFGEGDIPAGIVRDLKDPQREINKRRVQQLHILNSASNGGGWIEEDAMSPMQKERFRDKGNIPGYFAEVRPGGISKIRERQLVNPPTAVIQQEQMATDDIRSISGINEALMGTDIQSSSSGRAIELKQKQAITHLASIFDYLRKAKKGIAYRLWGSRGHKGIIPQYYTEDKVYRVEGTNGQKFIRVNQQVMQQDPLGNTIHQTLNDLSQGDFDIVIADTQASTTQRQAQMWGLVDAVSKLGIPGDLVFDVILDLSDLPDKETIKQRWQQRQQAQAQQSQQQVQQQMQLELMKQQNMNQSITYKDAPLPIQLAMAAKQGLIDPEIAKYATQVFVQQMFPQFAAEQQAKAQASQSMQLQQALQGQQMQQQTVNNLEPTAANGQVPAAQAAAANTSPAGQTKPLTAAAVKSLMAGQTPAV